MRIDKSLLRYQQSLCFPRGCRLDTGYSCDLPPRDQTVDLICTFVGVNWLQIAECLQIVMDTIKIHDFGYKKLFNTLNSGRLYSKIVNSFQLHLEVHIQEAQVAGLNCSSMNNFQEQSTVTTVCIWSWSHYYYGKSKLKCLILFCDPSRFSQYKDTIYFCKVTDLTFATRKSARIPFPPKSSLPRATVSRARSVFHACNKSKNENTHISQTKKAFCDWNKDSCSNKFLDKWTRWCNW